MNRSEILTYLQEVGKELDQEGVCGELTLVLK